MVKNTTEESVVPEGTELAVTSGSTLEAAQGATPEEGAVATAETRAESSSEAKSEAKSEAQPLAVMTPEERFRATTKLIFLAPDVPPIPPRPRRSEIFRSDAHRAESHRAESHRADSHESRRGDSRRGDGYRGDTFRGDSFRSETYRRDTRGDSHASDFRQLDELLDDHAPHDRDGHGSYDTDGERSGSRRTRRRDIDDDAPRRERRQAPVVTEPQKVRGSTRLEAKKQRRRDGRDAGRRRSVITESEFLARREAVDREMIVRTTADRVQIGVLEDKVLVEHYVARSSESSLIGNVYLGRVQNVLPSMEAAFVDIGRGRNAVLYSGEVDWSEFEGGNTARKIENALKPGDQVLVQVTKDPVGHKGARLTSQISLPGRFLVYVPGGAMNGISRKLPDTERARLKKILKEVLPGGAGVIVRTAAEGATEEQLTHDVERLTRQWESIQQRVAKGGGPVLLHAEPDVLIKIVRDVFNEDFHRMRISGDDTYTVIENYLGQVAPDLLLRVEKFESERDIFDEYRVTEQIAKALDRKVWLPSGGSLVIDRTEAMTVIDVNTGKFVGSGGNLEETVTKNNLESAEEIVRQLRLRDIGGIIVIDFIDMVLESNRDLVLRRLVECLSRDRTKHQVAEVTSLGLVQMTRKKLGLGLLESFSEACETCAGRGVIVQHDPVSRHRSEGNPRNAKRGRGNQQHQSHQSHQAQQHPEAKAQTHAITDGAKNMLAQVAASTLPVKHEDTAESVAAQLAAAVDAAAARKNGGAASGAKSAPDSPKASSGVTGRVRSRQATQESTPQQDEAKPVSTRPEPVKSEPVKSEPVAANLLDSVLSALPDAPAAGQGRARRRVSTGQTQGGTVAAPSQSAAPEAATDPAQAAKLALAEALDATAKRRDADRE
ncbi:Rne/Rng family ribonuclease [Leucobacter sp. HY1910]